MTCKPETNVPANAWLIPLTVGVAIGIGVPIARMVGSTMGLDSAWGVIAVNCAFAGLVGGIVASVISGVLYFLGRRKQAAAAASETCR